MDDNEIASGDISLLGIELTLFEGTFANEQYVLACTALGCSYLGNRVCGGYGKPGQATNICYHFVVWG